MHQKLRAIGIAKTLIARSCVMLLEELFNAIGQRLETPNLRSLSNGDQTPHRKHFSASVLAIETSVIGCNR